MVQLDIRAMWKRAAVAKHEPPAASEPPASIAAPPPAASAENSSVFVICAPVEPKRSTTWPPLQAGAQCAVVYV